MRYARYILPIALTLMLAGCTTLYTSAVTITQVVDTASKAYAELKVNGKTTPAIDAAVKTAHDRYRQACAVAAKGLQTYKDTGDPTSYNTAFEVVRAMAQDIIAILQPLLDPAQVTKLKTQLSEAQKL